MRVQDDVIMERAGVVANRLVEIADEERNYAVLGTAFALAAAVVVRKAAVRVNQPTGIIAEQFIAAISAFHKHAEVAEAIAASHAFVADAESNMH